MPFTVIPDGWRVSLEGTYQPSLRTWAMVFGVLDTASHTNARALDIGNTFITWWGTYGATGSSAHIQLDQVRITDLTSSTGPSVVDVGGLPVPGAVSGDPTGGQVAALITLLSGSRGRANRGRKYHPGLPDSALNAADGTQLDPGLPAVYAAIYVQLITAIAAMSSSPSLAIISESQALAIPVLAVQARTNLGTQRRRVRA